MTVNRVMACFPQKHMFYATTKMPFSFILSCETFCEAENYRFQLFIILCFRRTPRNHSNPIMIVGSDAFEAWRQGWRYDCSHWRTPSQSFIWLVPGCFNLVHRAAA